MLNERRSKNTSLLLALLGAAVTAASGQPAELTGVVRDARGVPQLGVLVELLGPGGVQTALTDAHGRYTLRDLHVGQYELHTSGPFFLPTTLRNVRVHAGAMPAVNLILTGLFDEVGLLTPHTRASGDSVADWKWTLRSPSARPMLRLADNDPQRDGTGNSLRAEQPSSPREGAHGAVRVAGGTGTFGVGREEVGFRVGAQGRDAHVEDTMELLAGSAGYGGEAAPASVSIRHVSGRGQDVQREVRLRASTLPQVVVGGSSGLELLEVESGQRVSVGSWAAMELGGRAELAHGQGSAFRVLPEVRLIGTPSSNWVIGYEYIGGQGGEADRVPLLATTSRGLALVSGGEQAIRVRHRSGRAHLEAALLHERQGAGVLSGAFIGRVPNEGARGPVMVDRATETFRQAGPGYAGFGGVLAAEVPLGEQSSAFVRAMVAPGLALAGQGALAAAELAEKAGPREAPAVLVGMKHSLARSGTEAAVSYRWQPAAMLTTVGAFESAGVAPYLGVHVRQRLPLGRGEGRESAELTIDATNVLGEGTHRVSGRGGNAPGQADALLMSALRELRAGIEMSF